MGPDSTKAAGAEGGDTVPYKGPCKGQVRANEAGAK